MIDVACVFAWFCGQLGEDGKDQSLASIWSLSSACCVGVNVPCFVGSRC